MAKGSLGGGARHRAKTSRFSGLCFAQVRLGGGHVISSDWKLSQQPMDTQ